jgi:hypothetical protein
VYRYVIHHTWQSIPQLEAGKWVSVLCPPASNPEALTEGQCRIRIGDSVIIFTAVRCPICDFPGRAFEIAAGDELPVQVMMELLDRVWDRFSRAVVRETPRPGGGSFQSYDAHLNTIEVPSGM